MTECSVGVKPFRGKAEMTGNVSDDRSEFGHQQKSSPSNDSDRGGDIQTPLHL